MARYEIDNVASPIDFKNGDPLKRTLQNAKNLLMCHMGEVPYDRCRGFDAKLYDLPIGRFNDELLPELDRLMRYEPDVEAVTAAGTLFPNGQIYIRCTLEVNDRL